MKSAILLPTLGFPFLISYDHILQIHLARYIADFLERFVHTDRTLFDLLCQVGFLLLSTFNNLQKVFVVFMVFP